MTAVLVLIIGLLVAYVLYQIARITVAQFDAWRRDERVAGRLVDEPTAEEVGQLKMGVRSSDVHGQ